MVIKLIIISISILMAAVLTGCNEESIRIATDQIREKTDFEGRLLWHTECKDFKKSELNYAVSDSSSCIEYLFEPDSGKLILKHINAGFNCCPDSLYCRISLRNDTLFVEEYEMMALCDCNCLFDLFIGIDGVEAKKYYFRIIEPYCMDQEKLYFEVDLTATQQGAYCVKRTGYPWGGI